MDRRSFVRAAGAGVAVAGISLWSLRTSAHSVRPTPWDIRYGNTGAGVMFAPSSTRPMPALLLFDPSGNAGRIVERYWPAASKRGWVLASSRNVRNGTPDESDRQEMLSLLAHVRTQASLDPRRIYAAGFSGGACGAYRLAIVESQTFAGAIECGHMGPWREVGSRVRAELSFYLFTRDADMNQPAMRELQRNMNAAHCRTLLAQRPGGHAPMSGDDVEGALQWLDATR